MNESDEISANESPVTDNPRETPPDAAAAPTVNLDALRQQRIAAAVANALTEPNLELGNIDVLNGGLMRIGQLTEAKILKDLSKCVGNDESLTAVLPLIDTHLKVVRQSERHSKLRIQIVQQQHTTTGQNGLGTWEQFRKMCPPSENQAKF